MKYFNNKNLLICVFILICSQVFSQDYTTETIKLWGEGEIPFNKENNTLKEILDKAGVRYTQISEPAIYVYRNKDIKNNGAALLFWVAGYF